MDKERLAYIKARKKAIIDKIDAFEALVDEAVIKANQALRNVQKEVLEQEDFERILQSALDALVGNNQHKFFRTMDRLVTRNLLADYDLMKSQILAGQINEDLLLRLKVFNKKLSTELARKSQASPNNKKQ